MLAQIARTTLACALLALPLLATADPAGAASHSGTNPNAPGSTLGTLVLAAGVAILCALLARLLKRPHASRY